MGALNETAGDLPRFDVPQLDIARQRAENSGMPLPMRIGILVPDSAP